MSTTLREVTSTLAATQDDSSARGLLIESTIRQTRAQGTLVELTVSRPRSWRESPRGRVKRHTVQIQVDHQLLVLDHYGIINADLVTQHEERIITSFAEDWQDVITTLVADNETIERDNEDAPASSVKEKPAVPTPTFSPVENTPAPSPVIARTKPPIRYLEDMTPAEIAKLRKDPTMAVPFDDDAEDEYRKVKGGEYASISLYSHHPFAAQKAGTVVRKDIAMRTEDFDTTTHVMVFIKHFPEDMRYVVVPAHDVSIYDDNRYRHTTHHVFADGYL